MQCGRWAVTGRRYCKRHNGAHPQFHRTCMAGYYSVNAGPALKAKLEELAQSSPGDRMSLKEEVDFVRMLALEAVALFDAALVSTDDGTKARAAACARGAMESVAGMVEKAARVRSVAQDTIDLEQVDYIVAQVVQIIERRVARVNKELADEIMADIADIKMPDVQHRDSRAIAEDVVQTLRAMNGTIPEAVNGRPAA